MNFIVFLPLIVMAVLFIIRAPIGFSMFCACITYFLATGKDVGLISEISMTSCFNTTVIVAIPLFIFVANLMNSSKVTEHMFTFCKSVVGKKRGATAYINILLSLVFSGMTGSAMADACGIGTMEVDQMKKDGYDTPFSCAITVASATVGPIFPPSIPMIIYGMIAQVSVGALFAGGMIPAVLICVTLGIYVWYISRKRKYPYGVHFTFKEFLKYTLKALPALFTIVILLGGIYSGFVTPTEAGALAAFYVIIISIVIYRNLSFKKFLKICRETVISTGFVMLIAMSAWVMSNVVTSTGMDEIIKNWFLSITDNKYIFLLMVNILFLFLGMLFDTGVLEFVFIPLVVPIAVDLGINLIHFGVVIVVNMMIGLSTPPFGMTCFSISALTKEPLKNVFKEVIPMNILMIVILLIITYIPEIVMFIPNLIS